MSTQNYTSIENLIKQSISQKTSHVTPPTHKESEPPNILTQETQLDTTEIQTIIEKETVDDTEVKPYVKVENKIPAIPQEVKKAGVQVSQQPVNFPIYQTEIPLPLTDEEIATDLQQPITSSKRWLATFALYLLHRSHLTIKIVKGHVMRIVKK